MKTILVVDDESSIQFLFSRMFKKEVAASTYKLIYAENGQEALEILDDEGCVDLIISDINMPVMDGFELLKNVKEKHVGIPVFMASAYSDEERQVLAKELGAQKYITKPVNFPTLKEDLIIFFS
ncbi:response regulator [Halobacteriovorax sp. HLS]|uniref:response regulator n=1 Tax=Halobacteriovorax sp. HLS TaxID=2234000 RepID=UPI000FD8A0D7|nr:response regulator [Halobacteriovorax sp. HLS]